MKSPFKYFYSNIWNLVTKILIINLIIRFIEQLSVPTLLQVKISCVRISEIICTGITLEETFSLTGSKTWTVTVVVAPLHALFIALGSIGFHGMKVIVHQTITIL